MSHTMKRGEHAVVLGASMAGLLAGRVLADFYDRVTVVERDVLSEDPVPRRGVPQGRHLHVLLGRGSHVLGELFPGILEELTADGVPVWNDGDLSKLYLNMGGHELMRSGTLRDPKTMIMYMASRPFLECHVRRRIRLLPNVTLLDGHDVVEYLTGTDRRRVTGVRIAERDDGAARAVTADLVVDASGRGSRTPVLLDALGYGRPPEREVMVRVAYASQMLDLPADAGTECLVAVSPAGQRLTSMGLVRCEHDRWVFTVGGFMNRQPPLDHSSLLRFAEDTIPAHLLPALQAATPLSDVFGYRVPSNRWRRYDKMTRLPDGLLVTGDAICSFNPVYGQGMTVAALDALALRKCLRQGVEGRGSEGLPRRFYRTSAKSIGLAWRAATGSDLALPEIPGRRTVAVRATNGYLDRVLAAAESDPLVYERFLRSMQLIDPPARLMSPAMLARAAVAGHRRSNGATVVRTPTRDPVLHNR